MIGSPLTVIVAAYNEEEGIAPTLSELKESLNKSSLLVVDGNNSDRTLELAKDLGAQVLTQKGKGKGNAISEGLVYINGDSCYVAFTDADYTYPAKYLKEMINVLDLNPKVGMVLGDRFSQTYEESDRNQFYIGNRILGFAQSMFHNSTYHIPTSSFSSIDLQHRLACFITLPRSQLCFFDVVSPIGL